MIEDTSLAQRPLRGLRQTSLAFLIALTATALMWFGWAWIAHRRLAAQIDAIAALQQPFYEGDFAPVSLPDEENAALLWKRTYTALPDYNTSPTDSTLQFNPYPPYPPEWHRMEDMSEVTNRIGLSPGASRRGCVVVSVGRITRGSVPTRQASQLFEANIVHSGRLDHRQSLQKY